MRILQGQTKLVSGRGRKKPFENYKISRRDNSRAGVAAAVPVSRGAPFWGAGLVCMAVGASGPDRSGAFAAAGQAKYHFCIKVVLKID
jgi:hypothetical protein